MMSKIYDVAVIGAGPGGSAVAYYLAQQGLDVLLLDRAEFPRDKTCGDGLTPRALGVLQDMGILSEVHAIGFRINGIELHGAKGNQIRFEIPFLAGLPDHLVIAPRFKLDDLIRRHALTAGVDYHSPVQVSGIEKADDQVEIMAGRLRYSARLAVLAAGGNQSLLRKMGILKYKPEVILAARGYYEGVHGLKDCVQAHFAEVPLPGYGWVFPVSESMANIGVGYWPSKLPWRPASASSRTAMLDWLERSEKMRAMLANAHLVDSIKGYPLRVDFPTAPTQHGRLLLVGESAGLVSPLSGEGIDFALESGKLAAEFIGERFRVGDLSQSALAGYDAMLRRHFQRLFVFLGYLRQFYINPILMDRAIRASRRFEDVRENVVKVLLSETDAAELLHPVMLRKIILGV